MPNKIFGRNVVLNAVEANRKFFEIYVSYQSLQTCEDVLKYANDRHVKINILSRKEMDLKFPNDKHQGIVAFVEDYQYFDLDKIIENNDSPFLVILDGLEDPHNLGAILRTADATNVDCVIIPKNRSVGLNSTVAKVSTGAIEHVPVAQVTNLTQTIKKIKEHGIWVVGADTDSEMKYNEIDGNMRIALVIGSEGKGISRLVKEQCDYLVNIPMNGHVNSLNASVSAALLMYQVFNDRN
ncbi:23S rRNA (guanosine(2251)-2'-O)-methyltransferase RlmB [Mycoplasmatota bacterium]|nr:23S rRNA (guanosine(2251)-2'-O)-methyltransferase RlmB [Mycoplasmatota bacterium]